MSQTLTVSFLCELDTSSLTAKLADATQKTKETQQKGEETAATVSAAMEKSKAEIAEAERKAHEAEMRIRAKIAVALSGVSLAIHFTQVAMRGISGGLSAVTNAWFSVAQSVVSLASASMAMWAAVAIADPTGVQKARMVVATGSFVMAGVQMATAFGNLAEAQAGQEAVDEAMADLNTLTWGVF